MVIGSRPRIRVRRAAWWHFDTVFKDVIVRPPAPASLAEGVEVHAPLAAADAQVFAALPDMQFGSER